MTFAEEFLLCLRWRPAQAIEASYWWMTRRRVRARHCLRRNIGDAPYAYDVWIDRIEKADRSDACRHDDEYRPLISIVLTDEASADAAALNCSFLSILQQSYSNWELLVSDAAEEHFSDQEVRPIFLPSSDGGSAFSRAVARAQGEYLFRLRAGNQMSPDALSLFVAALRASPASALLYGDQDEIDPAGIRQKPWLKPEWNVELFLAQDYLSDSCLIATQLARSALGAVPDRQNSTLYSILLTATAMTSGPIQHVHRIVCHVASGADNSRDGTRIETVRNHLRPYGASATEGPFETVRVHWPLPPVLPLVSIIVPTRDKVELLRPCISSVLEKTSYSSFEVIVVDNQSEIPETKRYFHEIEDGFKVKVVKYDYHYNYSSINNFAVTTCSGEIICLLNNDTEVINSEWLSELVRYAVRPEVGAVGAMLLYDDDTIQHAGVVVGLGEAAGHAHRHLRRAEKGYFGRAHVPHFVSAVTGACLVIERRKFDAVGGLDEAGFANAFNDVDFCLKLEKAGWRNVYAPQAMLYHHESKSRGNDLAPANLERYRRELALLQERWGTKTYVDPLHHPHLDRSFETYTIDLGK